MKKALLSLAFLAGCSSGFSETRLDGLAYYTRSIDKSEQLAQYISDIPAFGESKEFQFLSDRFVSARAELKTQLTKSNDKDLRSAITGIRQAHTMLSPIRLRGIAILMDIREGLNEMSTKLKSLGKDKDDKWLAAVESDNKALSSLSLATTTSDNKGILAAVMRARLAHMIAARTFWSLTEPKESSVVPTPAPSVDSKVSSSDHLNKGPVVRPDHACDHVRCDGGSCKMVDGKPTCVNSALPKAVH